MKVEKCEFQSAIAGLFAYVKSENKKRNFGSKMSPLYLSISTKLIQHHALFLNFFSLLSPWSAHLAVQCFKLAEDSKLQPCVLTCSSMVRRASQLMFELFIERIPYT